MENKTTAKFRLPSPSFSKSEKQISKSTLHYLTPCGMTLLPRSKQPPPMYGARGSTVPAKYLYKEEQPQQVIAMEPPMYEYISPPQSEYCENCGMRLATAQDMKYHLEQHEPCPVDDCNFAALHNILERHIEANHITGLYHTVKRVWTPVEIAAWRAERRKRFPTAANVELARRAQEQRQLRGERLTASKARFGNKEDRRRSRPNGNNERQPRKKLRSNKPKGKYSKQPLEQPMKELTNVSSTGVPMFRGTSQMADYKHLKDKKAGEFNALSSMLGMYGSESEDDEEDESISNTTEVSSPSLAKEEVTEKSMPATTEDSNLCLANEVDKEQETTTVISPAEASLPLEDPTGMSADEPVADNIENATSSSDEAPDEAPIERITEIREPAAEITPTTTDQPRPCSQPAAKRSAPKPRNRVYGLNYKKARSMRQQNTMLEKLLAPDIRHERNVLLQCVRFVCEQNFFGIGATSTSKESNSEKNLET